MAIVRPHGSRFSRHRPEPTSRVFRSMRPFSRLLLFSSFFMVFANPVIAGPAEESNGFTESPARDESSLRNVNRIRVNRIRSSIMFFFVFNSKDFSLSPMTLEAEADANTPKVFDSF